MLLFGLLVPQAALSAEAYLAWFTNATIAEGQKLSAPPNPPTLDPNGTKGSCLDLTKGHSVIVPSMSDTSRGVISFWIRPKEDGLRVVGGSEHVLLTAGNPKVNGLQISWDNLKGVLRFTMTGKNGTAPKTTVCRADISNWQANDWHHVQVAWLDRDGVALGLAVWIDRVALASSVFGGTDFLDPLIGSITSVQEAQLSCIPTPSPSGSDLGIIIPKQVTPSQIPVTTKLSKSIVLGDRTSRAYMDELIFRFDLVWDCNDNYWGGTPIAYKDYFRTAPYTSIQITHKANRVSSDPWVLLGKKKQLGLIATRLLNTATGETTTEYITNFDRHYGQWSEFDAKPYITWKSNNTSRAAVDYSGLVTGAAITTVPVTISASFGGLNATYSMAVKSWSSKADLCLMYVERTPRYSKYGSKKWPAAGDIVTSKVNYGNFGFQTVNNFKILFELIPDSNNNFKLDEDEAASVVISRDITAALAPNQTAQENFNWTWPANGLTTGSVFVRVTLDSGEAVSEICEANNQRCEKNNAKAFDWGYHPSKFSNDYNSRVVNLVGSFSDYDWYNAQAARASMMMQEAVHSTTSPNGILDACRVDMFTAWEEPDASAWHDADQYFDGGFPQIDLDFGSTPMDIDTANLHEIGHTTIGTPDLYGHPMTVYNMLLKDPIGQPYYNSVLFPVVGTIGYTEGDRLGMWSSATSGYPDQLGVGYSALMDSCHLWIDKMEAGLAHLYRQNRNRDYPWHLFSPRAAGGGPSKNSLLLLDKNDNPLNNAAVYLYQCINTGYLWAAWNKYYPDRPKFAGNSDAGGVYVIPTMTATSWDDWTTSRVEGAVACTSPFDYTGYWGKGPGAPNWQWGEMMLIKVVGANGETEFHVLALSELNAAYFENIVKGGNSSTPAQYAVRTSLTGAVSPVDVILPTIPNIIKTSNLAPVAGVVEGTSISVPAGQSFTLHGSASYDPEGQPLYYWWNTPSNTARTPSITERLYDRGEHYYYLYVTDGLRYSQQQLEIIVTVY